MNGQPVPVSDGRSLKGLLQGNGLPLHAQPICCEHEGNIMVRDGEWKLVRFFSDPWELYQVETDRSETNNRAAEHPEIVERLGKAYDEWAKRVGALPWGEAKNYSVYPSGKYNF